MTLISSFALVAAVHAAPKIDCDKEYADSFNSVKEMNAVIPALKKDVERMRARIQDLKKQCWANERRTIDIEIMALKSEIDRIVLNSEMQKLKDDAEAIR
jgi:uncharacterized small protein (DUF1192 family)